MEARAKTKANTNNKNKRKHKKSTGNRLGITLVVALLVIALGLGGTIIFIKYNEKKDAERLQQIVNADTFRDGVTVNGVPIGGLTMQQAAEQLKAAEEELKGKIHFEFTENGRVHNATAADFEITFNTQEVLEEAFALAREGSLEQLEAELSGISANGREFTLDYTISPASVSAYIQKLAAEGIDTAPTPATFTVPALPIDEETEAPKAADLGIPEGALSTDPRDYRFEFTEAVDGYGVDREALLGELLQRIQARDYGTVEVPLAPIQSDVTIATIKEQLVLRASATTSFAKGSYSRASRVFNIRRAAGRIYGTVLQPGEEFSCNTIIGDRTLKLGWQMAPAVIEGGAATEDQAGGGVCQVSTTLYNAVLMSDLEIVHRRAHSQRLSYVDGGLDATINTGTIDFVFANNTASPIYVFAWVDTEDKRVYCEIYGEPFPEEFDEITLVSERLPDIEPGAPTYTVDATLVAPYWRMKNDAQTGYVYNTYKEYKKGGQTVETVLIGETKYPAHPPRYLVWNGYLGEPLLPEYKLEYVRD